MTNAEQLGLALTRSLVDAPGLNAFLDAALEAIGASLGAGPLAVYDYHEDTGRFDLLYFHGHPPEARSRLQRGMRELGLERALSTRDPFPAGDRLIVPFYFHETLEAALVVEGIRSGPPELCLLISRFLGLFLSSSRLAINRKDGVLPSSDLERARALQRLYLPGEPLATDRYQVYGYNASSAIVGGDYFDFFARPWGLQFLVVDACGHGLAAALIMSTFRGLLQSLLSDGGDPGPLFTRLNRHIFLESDIVQFLTGVFLDYHADTRELLYLNAGHYDPLLVHADGSASRLSGGGPPLGILKGFDYPLSTALVRPGDLAVLYTDGLAEIEDAAQDQFGAERILSAVVPLRAAPLEEVAAEVLRRAGTHNHLPSPEDDVTLLLARFG